MSYNCSAYPEVLAELKSYHVCSVDFRGLNEAVYSSHGYLHRPGSCRVLRKRGKDCSD